MTAHDPETGEVIEQGPHWVTAEDGTRVIVGEEPKRKRPRRKPPNHMAPGTWRYDTDETGRKFRRGLTPQETAEKERFRAEKEERDRQHRSLLASLVPTVDPPGESPAQFEMLFPMSPGKYPGKILVELDRPSGSTFVMTHRAWSGEDHGIEPFEYVNSYIRFAKQGLRYRTRGTMYASVAEMRAAAEALTQAADRIEASGGPVAETPHPLVRFPMPTETPQAEAPKLAPPPKPSELRVVVSCWEERAAKNVCENLASEGATRIEGTDVIITGMSRGAAELLLKRLKRSTMRARLEGA